MPIAKLQLGSTVIVDKQQQEHLWPNVPSHWELRQEEY